MWAKEREWASEKLLFALKAWLSEVVLSWRVMIGFHPNAPGPAIPDNAFGDTRPNKTKRLYISYLLNPNWFKEVATSKPPQLESSNGAVRMTRRSLHKATVATPPARNKYLAFIWRPAVKKHQTPPALGKCYAAREGRSTLFNYCQAIREDTWSDSRVEGTKRFGGGEFVLPKRSKCQ